ncbi:MAG: hypothetical protein ACRBK7_33220 [Acidimicrobiales bacterium]
MKTFPSKWFLGALLLCFVAFACSSGDGATTTGPDDSINSATTDQATTSAPTTAPTTTEAAPTTDPGLDPKAAALETWTKVLDAAKSGDPNEEQLTIIESLTNRNTAEQLKDFFPKAPARQLTHYPKLTTQDDDTIAIDDCIIMNRGISTGISNWFVGTAAPNSDSPTGWTINNLQLINLDPCVPRSIADAAIQGYEDHWDARGSYLDPPDLDSPELRETTTGVQLELLAGLVDRFTQDGQRLAGRPTTSPEFWEVNSNTEVVIYDCQEADPLRGVYDIATGDRTDLIPPITPGQFDAIQATLLFEEGRWKISDIQAQRDNDCQGGEPPKTIQPAGG